MLRRWIYQALYARRGAARLYKTLNRAELSRGAMLHNMQVVQAQHPKLSIIPVLKSNAYGHGLREVAEILNGADCDLLAVDGYFEAARIRHITKHHILVLGYILPDNVRLLDTKCCSFVVQDVAGLEAFGRLKRRVRVHLELNTGMNRLGLQPDELDEYLTTLKRFPNLELEGIMTHLADADNEIDDTFTRQQVTQFDQQVAAILAQGFKPEYIHIAQTAGSMKAQSQYANAMRLGIGLYGISPLGERDPYARDFTGLCPVLELKSTIIKIIDLQKGDRVSYNGIFTAPKAMKIGILPLGYYEGVPRVLSNVGVVTFRGKNLPIVGRVCMNHTMIDLGGNKLAVGDEVTVISADPNAQNSVLGMSRAHGLFSYGTLTAISSSIRRVIVA